MPHDAAPDQQRQDARPIAPSGMEELTSLSGFPDAIVFWAQHSGLIHGSIGTAPIVRRAFAKRVLASVTVQDQRLEEAFAGVERERSAGIEAFEAARISFRRQSDLRRIATLAKAARPLSRVLWNKSPGAPLCSRSRGMAAHCA
jgi:hypothetical protein